MKTIKSTVLRFTMLALSAAVISQTGGKAQSTKDMGQAGVTTVPRLIQFGGAVKDAAGRPVAGLTFALYKEQEGGAPVWMETQNVSLDENGRYTALLGATKTGGLPMELFISGEARWLGIQADGHPEQPRVLLLSVPYALKAADAETVGGLPPSAFMQAAQSLNANAAAIANPAAGMVAAVSSVADAAISGGGTVNFIPIWTSSTGLGNSALFQTGGKVGLGTTAPAATFDVRSAANSLQGVTTSTSGVGLTGSATAATGATFGVQGMSQSTAGVGVLGKNTAATGTTVGIMGQVSSPTGTAAVLNSQGGGDVLDGQVGGKTKFSMDKNGDFTITNGDLNVLSGNVSIFTGNLVFPDLTMQTTAANITQITAGAGLTGGGTKGNVSLKLDTALTDARYLLLAGGALSGPLSGTMASFSSSTGDGVVGNSSSGSGVSGNSGSGDGVVGHSSSGIGVVGSSGSSTGVFGNSPSGDGVLGTSTSKYGVHGISPTGFGVVGDTTSGVGVFGSGGTGASIGVEGSSASATGIGVGGINTASGGVGVSGQATSGGIGVEGTSKGFRGVVGNSDTKGGVVGFSTTGDGTTGVACASPCGSAGIFGMGQRAGLFQGNVGVTGTLAVTGFKAFHIDHPLDPANKYLNHAAVESSEVLNIYTGNVITDASGNASVALPEYFSALNGDFRYQLTVVGQFAQAIVSREIENNSFAIKTDRPSVKVSWLITALRQDAWMKNHPIQVEEDKPEQERGYYLSPELFGQPEEKGLSWVYRPDTMRDAKARWEREKINSK